MVLFFIWFLEVIVLEMMVLVRVIVDVMVKVKDVLFLVCFLIFEIGFEFFDIFVVFKISILEFN